MKQETKELIEWIKTACVQRAIREADHTTSGKACDFLNTLPTLEEQLKHGGFIPDMNNTPCKDRDYVSFYYKKSGYVETFTGTGTLTWDSTKSMFTVIGDDESPSFDGVYSKDIKLLNRKESLCFSCGDISDKI